MCECVALMLASWLSASGPHWPENDFSFCLCWAGPIKFLFFLYSYDGPAQRQKKSGSVLAHHSFFGSEISSLIFIFVWSDPKNKEWWEWRCHDHEVLSQFLIEWLFIHRPHSLRDKNKETVGRWITIHKRNCARALRGNFVHH